MTRRLLITVLATLLTATTAPADTVCTSTDASKFTSFRRGLLSDRA